MLAGTFAGAAAVLVPYHGLGVPDAFWAAAAGGTTALAVWRWREARELAGQPLPAAAYPESAVERARHTVEAALASLPGGRSALAQARRQRAQHRLRGSAVAPAWQRLDRACATLSGLAERMDGAAESAVAEAAAAECSLRDLAERCASVERALRLAPADAREALASAHRELVAQLDNGVVAYERLVAAAAEYVAEDAHPGAEQLAVARLRDATDLLRGIAVGLAELRTTGPAL